MKRINALLLALVILIASACVTTKSKDDELSLLGKVYHNTTAQYNGYFNADVLMIENTAKLSSQHQDNYNKILPIYKYVAASDPKPVWADMDKAIEKVSIVATLHPKSTWVDDCYLLLGQAQYLKKDYESAEETFEFMMTEFDPKTIARKKALAAKKKAKKSKKVKKKKKKKKGKGKKKKSKGKKSAKDKKKEQEKKRKEYNKNAKKKKKGKSSKSKESDSKKETEKVADAPKKSKQKKKEDADAYDTPKIDKKGALDKRPIYQDAQLWLARTYIMRDKFDEAEAILLELGRKPNLYKEVRTELAAVQAHYYLQQKTYDAATPFLEKAIELEKDRQKKARYAFIVAQIHQENNRTDDAFAYFNKAMKFSNNYEMEFSARLSMAQNSYQTGKVTPEQTTKSLTKLLKDSKNTEYKDQIYFALANVALDKNQNLEAINYLKESLVYNTSNSAQRGESYLKLADLNYEVPNYVDAKLYYDSTLQTLATTDDRYDRVSRYSTSLTDIATNIQIINLQDSLLRISDMSTLEQNNLAAKLKAEQDKALARATANKNNNIPFDKTGKNRTIQSVNLGGGSRSGGFNRGANNSGPSTFFAYNDRALKKEKKDFENKWGKRTLADDWRRSNRQNANDFAQQQEEETEDAPTNDLSNAEIERIFKDVPTTDEEKKAAYDLIADAMMKLGRLYRERIQRDDKTVEILEDGLLERFPKTRYELDAWYYLYLSHTSLNNKPQAKVYFDKIVNKYPTSTYANILEDPNFLADTQAKEKELSTYYKATFVAYEQGKFQSAFDRTKKSTDLFGKKNTLQAKFALLGALCTGNLQGKDAYIDALKNVIAKFPDTQEQTRAKEILRLLEGKPVASLPGGNGNLSDPEAAKKFKPEPDKLHYMLVVITDKGDVKISTAKTQLADFHRSTFKLEKMRIANIYLGTNTNQPIMVIRKFKNKDKAMQYYEAALSAGTEFIPEGMTFNIFPITQANYRQILRDKTLDGYQQFFEESYLEK